jgi:hypothetical protein
MEMNNRLILLVEPEVYLSQKVQTNEKTEKDFPNRESFTRKIERFFFAETFRSLGQDIFSRILVTI